MDLKVSPLDLAISWTCESLSSKVEIKNLNKVWDTVLYFVQSLLIFSTTGKAVINTIAPLL